MLNFIAIIVGKILIFLCRFTGVGGGLTLPGLVAEKISPQILTKITKSLKNGSIIITGTNGKTTTVKMLANILARSGFKVVYNHSGSNLTRGLVSALIEKSNLFGKIEADIGVFEVDEGTIPEAVVKINPKIILVTNLFRDQLDRYGELDRTREIIGKAISNSKESLIILNADDPLVASLANYLQDKEKRKVAYFGIDDETYTTQIKEHAADSEGCPKCGGIFNYQARFFSQTGKYKCSKCGFNRPSPQIKVLKLKIKGVSGIDLKINTLTKQIELKTPIFGFYNVYNILAAVSIASVLKIDAQKIKEGLEVFKSAFGRLEKVDINNKNLYLLLVKNPAGFNQVIKTLNSDINSKGIILALNDNLADGTDISWVWDVDLEFLDKNFDFIITSGMRAEDMALRLKYSGIDLNKIIIQNDLEKSLYQAIKKLKLNQNLYVLPTYTAMMEIRKILTSKGYLKAFWKPK